MKKIIKKIGLYKEKGIVKYDGFGYLQGMGIAVNVDYLYIFGVRIITDFNISVQSEYTKKLRRKLEEDKKQEKIAPYKAKLDILN